MSGLLKDVAVIRRQVVSPDGMGGMVQGWLDDGSAVSCRLTLKSTKALRSAGANRSVGDYVVFLPVGTEVVRDDRLLVTVAGSLTGVEYQVEFAERPSGSPFVQVYVRLP